MTVIWLFILVISVIFAMIGGTAQSLTAALFTGAERGVTLCLTIAGPLCLWSGVSLVMERSGLSEKLARLCTPLLGRLFPAAWQDRQTRSALCGNFSANLLGLGNAATPPGIQAAVRMADGSGRASDELCKLIVMNTASFQLIPATVAALRAFLGAAAPFDILPAVWITSFCSVAVGLLAARVLSKWC